MWDRQLGDSHLPSDLPRAATGWTWPTQSVKCQNSSECHISQPYRKWRRIMSCISLPTDLSQRFPEYVIYKKSMKIHDNETTLGLLKSSIWMFHEYSMIISGLFHLIPLAIENSLTAPPWPWRSPVGQHIWRYIVHKYYCISILCIYDSMIIWYDVYRISISII